VIRRLVLLPLLAMLLVPAGPARAQGGDASLEPDSYVNARHWMSPTVVVRVDWFGSEELESYDLKVSRTDPRRGSRSAWTRPERLQGVTGSRFRLPNKPGSTLCASVRGRTTEGAVSTWSDVQCSTRAFGVGRLRKKGSVSVVEDGRMWGDRALVATGDGRVTLPGLEHGNGVGFVVTRPAGGGGQRGYRFRTSCGPQPRLSDVNRAGDPVRRNIAIDLAYRTRSEPCRLVYRAGEGTVSSFPLQAMMVWPRW
jgi:hypothetical protein